MIRGASFLLIMLTSNAFGADINNVYVVHSGLPISGTIPSRDSSPGNISVTFENTSYTTRYMDAFNNWNRGETLVIQELVEQESGNTIPIITCTKGVTRAYANCSGPIKKTNGFSDHITGTGTFNLKLNNTGERKTRWCNRIMNYDKTYSSNGCTNTYERGVCTFTTTAPTAALTTYVAGSREDQATASVSWSCPQNERPKIEILDQTYSDDCRTSNEYQDVKNASGTDIAKYRVKLEGVCNDHTPVHARSGNITTRIYGKGVSAGTGTTSFVMRISLP